MMKILGFSLPFHKLSNLIRVDKNMVYAEGLVHEFEKSGKIQSQLLRKIIRTKSTIVDNHLWETENNILRAVGDSIKRVCGCRFNNYFSSSIPQHINRLPSGQEIDLFQFYTLVIERGGLAQVTIRDEDTNSYLLWLDIAKKLNCESVYNIEPVLCELYMRWLWNYEQIFWIGIKGSFSVVLY